MKHKLAMAPALVAALTVTALTVHTTGSPAGSAAKPSATSVPAPTWRIEDYGPRADDNALLKWNEQVLGTIRANPGGTGPTLTARARHRPHTATYDAWAAYDGVAKGTRFGSLLRRPQTERTGVNKTKGISYAAWRTLSWLFRAGRRPMTRR